MTNSVTLKRFDPADHLKDEADMVAYLEVVAEEYPNDPSAILRALGVVARAQNMSKLARDSNMTREGLYKALSGDGNPSFANVARVCAALGLRVSFEPA